MGEVYRARDTSTSISRPSRIAFTLSLQRERTEAAAKSDFDFGSLLALTGLVARTFAHAPRYRLLGDLSANRQLDQRGRALASVTAQFTVGPSLDRRPDLPIQMVSAITCFRHSPHNQVLLIEKHFTSTAATVSQSKDPNDNPTKLIRSARSEISSPVIPIAHPNDPVA